MRWWEQIVVTDAVKKAKCDGSCKGCKKTPRSVKWQEDGRPLPDDWKQHARRGEFKIGLSL